MGVRFKFQIKRLLLGIPDHVGKISSNLIFIESLLNKTLCRCSREKNKNTKVEHMLVKIFKNK